MKRTSRKKDALFLFVLRWRNAHAAFEDAGEVRRVGKAGQLSGMGCGNAVPKKGSGLLAAVLVEICNDGGAGKLFELTAKSVFVEEKLGLKICKSDFLSEVFFTTA